MNFQKITNFFHKKHLYALIIILIIFIVAINIKMSNNNDQKQLNLKSTLSDNYLLCSQDIDSFVNDAVNNPIQYSDITSTNLDEYSKSKRKQFIELKSNLEKLLPIEQECLTNLSSSSEINLIIDENL